MEPSLLGEGGRRPDEGQASCSCPFAGPRQTLRPHQSAGGAADSFPRGGSPDCRKRCAHPLAPSARGLRPQAVGERTVRLPEIFRAMARFSPSAPSGHLPRRGRFFGTLPPLCQGRLFHFGTFFHLFCSIGIFFDCFAQIGCFCGSYYTIMIKYRRMYIFTARLLRLEL